MFENIIGQDRALRILRNAITSEKISQAYIFYGPEGVGKFLTALSFAKVLNCLSNKEPSCKCTSCVKITNFVHPDVRLFFPIPNFDLNEYGFVKLKENQEKDPSKNADFVSYNKYIENKMKTPWEDYRFTDKACSIRIEQIRALQKDIMMSKYEGKKKVYILENFDSLTHNASNAFLKTLEEPPPDTHFILIVRNIEKLLPTILSRCLKIEFFSIRTAIIEDFLINNMYLDKEKANLYARISNGSLEKSFSLFYNGNLEIIDISTSFIRIVDEKDDTAFLEWMDKYFPKGAKNTDLFRSFVLYLYVWIRDKSVSAISDRHIDGETPSVQPNYIKTLLSLNEYLEKHAGNVNPKLLLSQIYINLCSIQ